MKTKTTLEYDLSLILSRNEFKDWSIRTKLEPGPEKRLSVNLWVMRTIFGKELRRSGWFVKYSSSVAKNRASFSTPRVSPRPGVSIRVMAVLFSPNSSSGNDTRNSRISDVVDADPPTEERVGVLKIIFIWNRHSWTKNLFFTGKNW